MNVKAEWEKFSRSSASTATLAVVGIVLVGLLIFHAGVAYGERNAFSRMNGPSKETPSGFGFGFLPHGFIPEGHGAVGTISAVTLPTFTLVERDGDQETVRVSSSTVVHSDTGANTLQVGDSVVVIGAPNDEATEQMSALLIHILPSP